MCTAISTCLWVDVANVRKVAGLVGLAPAGLSATPEWNVYLMARAQTAGKLVENSFVWPEPSDLA
jgi:hypothetical protein